LGHSQRIKNNLFDSLLHLTGKVTVQTKMLYILRHLINSTPFVTTEI
jgi:hypothetical protein